VPENRHILELGPYFGTSGVPKYDSAANCDIRAGDRVCAPHGVRSISAGYQRVPRASSSSVPTALEHSLLIRYGGGRLGRLVLTTREARVSVNTEALVAQALDLSGRAWFVPRAWRELTGGRLEANLRPSTPEFVPPRAPPKGTTGRTLAPRPRSAPEAIVVVLPTEGDRRACGLSYSPRPQNDEPSRIPGTNGTDTAIPLASETAGAH
jgi:hypothetical protein